MPNQLANEVKSIRQELGLSQEHFARIMNTSTKSISRWENKMTKPAPLAEEMLDFWDEVVRVISGFGDNPSEWIRRENPELGGKKPIDLAYTSEGRRKMIILLEKAANGIPG
jgi:transcriptional regulator with XRE-family HTH domain